MAQQPNNTNPNRWFILQVCMQPGMTMATFQLPTNAVGANLTLHGATVVVCGNTATVTRPPDNCSSQLKFVAQIRQADPTINILQQQSTVIPSAPPASGVQAAADAAAGNKKKKKKGDKKAAAPASPPQRCCPSHRLDNEEEATAAACEKDTAAAPAAAPAVSTSTTASTNTNGAPADPNDVQVDIVSIRTKSADALERFLETWRSVALHVRP